MTRPRAVLGVVETATAHHELVPNGRRDSRVRRVATTVLDWTIDGVPLREHLTDEGDDGQGFERVTMLGDLPDQACAQIDRLLGRDWPDGDDGRTALLVCAECGSLDCGAVTALVVFSRDAVEWRDVRFEFPTCHGHPTESEDPPVAFTFDRHSYTAVLLDLRARFDPGPVAGPTGAPHPPRG